jgi:hypothetical protein
VFDTSASDAAGAAADAADALRRAAILAAAATAVESVPDAGLEALSGGDFEIAGVRGVAVAAARGIDLTDRRFGRRLRALFRRVNERIARHNGERVLDGAAANSSTDGTRGTDTPALSELNPTTVARRAHPPGHELGFWPAFMPAQIGPPPQTGAEARAAARSEAVRLLHAPLDLDLAAARRARDSGWALHGHSATPDDGAAEDAGSPGPRGRLRTQRRKGANAEGKAAPLVVASLRTPADPWLQPWMSHPLPGTKAIMTSAAAAAVAAGFGADVQQTEASDAVPRQSNSLFGSGIPVPAHAVTVKEKARVPRKPAAPVYVTTQGDAATAVSFPVASSGAGALRRVGTATGVRLRGQVTALLASLPPLALSGAVAADRRSEPMVVAVREQQQLAMPAALAALALPPPVPMAPPQPRPVTASTEELAWGDPVSTAVVAQTAATTRAEIRLQRQQMQKMNSLVGLPPTLSAMKTTRGMGAALTQINKICHNNNV